MNLKKPSSFAISMLLALSLLCPEVYASKAQAETIITPGPETPEVKVTFDSNGAAIFGDNRYKKVVFEKAPHIRGYCFLTCEPSGVNVEP